MKRLTLTFGVLRLPLDFFLAIGAFLLAYNLRKITLIPGLTFPFDPTTFPGMPEYLKLVSVASGVLVAIFAVNQMYSLKTADSSLREISKVLFLSAAWLAIIFAYFFFKRSFPFSRLVLVYGWALTVIFVSGGRIFIRLLRKQFLKKGIGRTNVILVGEGQTFQELRSTLTHDIRYRIVAETSQFLREPFQTMIHALRMHEKPDEVLDFGAEKTEELFQFCREHHLRYSFVPPTTELQQKNIELKKIGEIPIVNFKPTPLEGWGQVFKRTMDIIGAAIGLIVLSPLLFITALFVKLDSRGPILFTKLDDGSKVLRVGSHGRLFPFYKFRTMHPNTHYLRYTELAQKNLRTDSPLVKIKDDPRITRIGKFLRRYSIDELPQLWNVLRGHMSLVGPRPHLPEEVSKYQNHHKFVLTIKPGITGLAQISGRSDLAFEDEIKLDTSYIQNWSPTLDLKILWRTLGAVLKGYKE